MPSASSLFSAIFRFRKVVKETFSELDPTNPGSHIFPGSIHKSEGDSKTGTGVGSPWPGAAPPLAAPAYGEGHLVAHRRRTFAYLYPSGGKP